MNIYKAEYFDKHVRAAWAYDEYTRDERARIERVLALANWRPGMTILEPGCGSGRLTRMLADKSEGSGFIYANDISAKMVHAARERVGKRPNVRIEQGAMEEIPLPAKSMDLVFLHQVFPHFDDKKRALAVIVKAMKPSACLIIHHFINSVRINDLHRKTDPAVKTDRMPDKAEMRALCQETGFQVKLFEDNDEGYALIAVLNE
jgi:demethylmenaquinone methyltransferase/2-methoxy-6-polyprenyl-1,4-benzoquinol methylase